MTIRLLLFIPLLTAANLSSSAQTQTITNIDNPQLRFTDVMSIENSTQGYYSLNEVKEKIKDQKKYNLTIFDNKLNNKGSCDVLLNKKTFVKKIAQNGTHLCINSIDTENRLISYDFYDSQAKHLGTFQPTFTEKEKKSLKYYNPALPEPTHSIVGVPSTGFIITDVNQTAGLNRIKLVGHNGKIIWEQDLKKTYPEGYQFIAGIYCVNSLLFVVTTEGHKKENKRDIIALDLQNGDIKFTIPSYNEKTGYYPYGIKYHPTSKTFLIYGAYGTNPIYGGADILRTGFYISKIDENGKQLNHCEIDWETKIKPLIPSGKYRETLAGSGIFLHEVIIQNNGDLLIVGERYMQKLRPTIGIAVGTGGAGQGGPSAQILSDISSLFLFNIAQDMSFKNFDFIDKGTHDAIPTGPYSTDGAATAHAYKDIMYFDYIGQLESSFSYLNIIKLKNKSAELKLIKYKPEINSFSNSNEKLISIETSDFKFLPNSNKSVLQIEHNSKTNELHFKLIEP